MIIVFQTSHCEECNDKQSFKRLPRFARNDNMKMDIVIILLVLVTGFASLFLFLNKKLEPKNDTTLLEWLKSMDKRLDLQTQKILESQKTIGEMSEIGRSMKDLQSFLASPKLRGGLGEQVLKELLEQSLPRANFGLQYGFRNGSKVDAVIKTTAGIIPIDSKFTMENFKRMHEDKSFEKDFVRDVKARIEEIAQKYILPDEGTVDFAIMYVPSEAVYYEICNAESDLINYAYTHRVMPVSPSTFYAFLRSVLLSLEGQKIAAEIKVVQQALRAIHTETGKFAEILQTLQTHINNSYHTMTRVATSFSTLVSKIESTKQLESPKEV